MNEIEQKITERILPIVEELGYWLVEVKQRVGAENSVNIYIDSKSGISLDDCEKVSNLVDPILDEMNLIECAYSLNVSSSGLDRPIVNVQDYERNIGREIEAKLFAPIIERNKKVKVVEGVLLGREETVVEDVSTIVKDGIGNIKTFAIIKKNDGEIIKIELSKIAKMTQAIRFE